MDLLCTIPRPPRPRRMRAARRILKIIGSSWCPVVAYAVGWSIFFALHPDEWAAMRAALTAAITVKSPVIIVGIMGAGVAVMMLLDAALRIRNILRESARDLRGPQLKTGGDS